MGLAERDYRPRESSASGFAAIREWSVTTWLIALIVGAFLLNALLTPPMLLPYMFLGDRFGDVGDSFETEFFLRAIGPLARYAHFSAAAVLHDLQLWRVVTYPFVHIDVWPLFINVACLYVFARVLEEEIGRRRFLALYAACTLAAPVAYVALYKTGVAIHEAWLPMLGASSGVLGVTIAAALAGPDDEVIIWTSGLSVRRRVLAWIMLAIMSVIVIKQDAIGAGAAHFGGTVAGLLAVPFLRTRGPRLA